MNAGDQLDWLKNFTPKEWRFKVILYVALAAGAIGVAIAWFEKGTVLTSLSSGMGLPMLVAPYLVAPRVKSQRVAQGAATGLLGGVFALAVMFVFDTPKYMPLAGKVGLLYLEYAVAAVAMSWLSAMLSKWTDKYAAKRTAQANEKRQRERVEQHKDRYRVGKDGKIERIHRKKRKKR